MELLDFDWSASNLSKLASRDIQPEEAQQAILNRPVDLRSELRNGEERIVQVGETNAARVLIVVSTTLADGKIRVVTSWPANDRFRRYFLSLKRNGNVGRIEDQDLRE
jgi:uncharacterized DUF497 family protein